MSKIRNKVIAAASAAGADPEALMMAIMDENSSRSKYLGLKGAMDDQQDWMAYQNAGSLRGKVNLDLGPYNINLDTAMAMNAKYGVGSSGIENIARDLLSPSRALPYAAAYMAEVQAALNPYLSGVSTDNRVGEYVQGWREGHHIRSFRYSPGVNSSHGMSNYGAKLSAVRGIIYGH